MSPPELILRPDKLDDRSYLPSYDFGASDLGEEHLGVEAVVRDVPGWMRPEDALKLYELAHFAPGPILEIGAYHGKSAIVLALGARAGRTGATVLSVDVDAHALRAARAQVGRHGVGGSVVFFRGSARALARAARGIRPGLVFVDGDHSRAGVLRDLAALEDQVPAGTLLLFHDYDDDPPLVAVRDSVSDSWVAHDCDFAGIFGCCGLFVRRRGGPDTEPGPRCWTSSIATRSTCATSSECAAPSAARYGRSAQRVTTAAIRDAGPRASTVPRGDRGGDRHRRQGAGMGCIRGTGRDSGRRGSDPDLPDDLDHPR